MKPNAPHAGRPDEMLSWLAMNSMWDGQAAPTIVRFFHTAVEDTGLRITD